MESEGEAIKNGETVVLFEDETHLVHGQVCGYAWGKRKERLYVPIKNHRERQTYYGALNGLTGELHLSEYKAGNEENTVSFLKELVAIYPNANRLIILWDNASYHVKSEVVRKYLSEINKDLPADKWKITCLNFAPNAPEQNPIEDVWLAGKKHLRTNFNTLPNFKSVKICFTSFYKDARFRFHKFQWYGL